MALFEPNLGEPGGIGRWEHVVREKGMPTGWVGI